MSDALSESLEQAWEDIEEWFADGGLTQTHENMRPGLEEGALDAAQQALGFELPAALRWLYARHDGQAELERFPLFEWFSFMPLHLALGEVRQSMFERYVYGLQKTRSPRFDGEYVRAYIFYGEDNLSEQEEDLRWIPFANTEGDFLAVHAGSGRVTRWLKGESPVGSIVAESLEAFLLDYADGLWADAYVIEGDMSLGCVEEEGLVFLGAYARKE